LKHITQPPNHLPIVGFAIALLGAVLFSTKAIIIKLAFANTTVNAVSLLALRMLFSLPFYIVIALMASYKKATPITTKQWWQIAGLGLLGYYASSLFDFIGLQYVSAGLERLILFLYPTFAVLLNTFLFRQKLSNTQIAALLLTYAGIGWAYFAELKIDNNNPNFLFGTFMIFLCAVTYSVYLVGTGKMVHKVGTSRYTAYAMLFATSGVMVHYAVTQNYMGANYSTSVLGYGALLAVVATVIPSFMISGAMKKIGSNNVSIVTSIGPVSTILQAHFILGEKILPAQIGGTILVLIGVLLIGWKSTRTKAPIIANEANN
jgi:drug/metabolite transporter (DMT)-like permease